MLKHRLVTPVLILVFLLAIVIFVVFRTAAGEWLAGSSEVILSPIQGKTQQLAQGIGSLSTNAQITKLTSENVDLTTELAKMADIKRENKALQDQFQTQSINTHTLIPAEIIGARSFIPGFSKPTLFILNRGSVDGVKKGNAVIYKDNLVGQVTSLFPHVSEITLVTNTRSSFTVQTVKTQALGIAKGDAGDGILLDNVVLTDKLEAGDLVETKGDMTPGLGGMPPKIVLGKIMAVHKQASSLFQTADVASLLDFSRLETVFVVTQ